MENFLKKIVKFTETKRGKAASKLLIWFVVLALLLIVSQFFKIPTNPSSQETKKEADEINYFLSMNEILNLEMTRNLNYKLVVSHPTFYYEYTGNRIEQIDSGIRESVNDLLKYEIIENIVYKIVLENRIEIDDLYPFEIKNDLQLSMWYHALQNHQASSEFTEMHRFYTYNVDGKIIVIKINYTKIEEITYQNGDYKAVWHFSDIDSGE